MWPPPYGENMSVTLDDIMVQSRERALMTNSQFIEDAEQIRLINRSYEELWDILIGVQDKNRFLDGYEFSTVIDQKEYSMPDNFYQFNGIDMKVSGVWHSLARFNHSDRNKYLNSTDTIVDGKPRTRYVVKNNRIDLLPVPTNICECNVHYIGQVTPLVNSSDKINADVIDAFVEYIIVDVAAKMKSKEQSDNMDLLQEKQVIIERINLGGNYDIATPEASQDDDNTLFNLRIQARYKSDMVNDQLVSDTELDHYINQSFGELQDQLVKAYDDHYFLDGYDFDTVSGQKDYSLPSDFYKLGGVDVIEGGEVYSLSKFNFQERSFYDSSYAVVNAGAPYFKYNLIGDEIRILPEPTAAHTMKLWYTKRLSSLSNDSDSMSSVIIQDWSEFLLLDVAIKMLSKKLINSAEPQKVQAALGELTNQKFTQQARLLEIAQNRDWGQPCTITDVRKTSSLYGRYGRYGR